MSSCEKGSKLIDWFPRNIDNITVCNEVVSFTIKVELVLSLVSNKEVMVSKIMERSKTSGRNDC
jgi:adenylate kinase family enzyme